ncbi:MAG: hypothetical protein QNJ40_10130 [Xanthomonadales bacterium]|nr:hypothetical protein [Xanthomonadales bacterium]
MQARYPRRFSRDPRLTTRQASRFQRRMSETFVATWQSDPLSIVVRTGFLTLTYWVLARAIARHDLGLGYILAVWVVEYLAILWLGVLLTRTWVREPIFQSISGSIPVALGWTVGLVGPYLFVLGWDEAFSLDTLGRNLRPAWDRAVDSGPALACTIVLTGLVLDTVRDVRQWKPRGGAFVWPATQLFGFRFVALIVLALLSPFVIIGVAAVLHNDLFAKGRDYAWAAWAALLAADLIVLVSSTVLHRWMSRPSKV